MNPEEPLTVDSTPPQNSIEGLVRARHFAKALELCAPQQHAHQGWVLAASGQIEEARLALKRALQQPPADPEGLCKLAEGLSLCNDDRLAARVFSSALKGHPADISLLKAYVELLLRYGEYEEAAKLGGRLVRLRPKDGHYRLLLAQALTSLERGDEARAHLEEATMDPEQAGLALAMLGFWHQARGNFAEAQCCFKKSIFAQPRQSLAYFGLSQSGVLGQNPAERNAITNLATDEALPESDQVALAYVLGKQLGNEGAYRESMEFYELANAGARKLNQGGRPFARERYQSQNDAIIEQFSLNALRDLAKGGPGSKLPIFIVGMMRSGTTLLEQILSSHPEVAAGGEVEFWLDHGLPMCSGGGFSEERLRNAAYEYLALLQAKAGNRPRITDKMPQNFQLLGLIHAAFPSAPILHVRRNPIDTCFSIYTTPYETSPDFAHDKSDIAFAYREYLRLVAYWQQVLPTDVFLEVSYEELLGDLENQVARILDFCGLSWSEACLHPEQNQRLITTPSLWQARQPLYKSSVDRWKPYEPWLSEFKDLVH